MLAQHRAEDLSHSGNIEFLIRNYLNDSLLPVVPMKVQHWTDYCRFEAGRDRSRGTDLFCIFDSQTITKPYFGPTVFVFATTCTLPSAAFQTMY